MTDDIYRPMLVFVGVLRPRDDRPRIHILMKDTHGRGWYDSKGNFMRCPCGERGHWKMESDQPSLPDGTRARCDAHVRLYIHATDPDIFYALARDKIKEIDPVGAVTWD